MREKDDVLRLRSDRTVEDVRSELGDAESKVLSLQRELIQYEMRHFKATEAAVPT